MKKVILGVAWQAMGFLGTMMILCSAAPHDWDYHGITGIIGDILGLDLMIPFLICVVFLRQDWCFVLRTLTRSTLGGKKDRLIGESVEGNKYEQT